MCSLYAVYVYCVCGWWFFVVIKSFRLFHFYLSFLPLVNFASWFRLLITWTVYTTSIWMAWIPSIRLRWKDKQQSKAYNIFDFLPSFVVMYLFIDYIKMLLIATINSSLQKSIISILLIGRHNCVDFDWFSCFLFLNGKQPKHTWYRTITNCLFTQGKRKRLQPTNRFTSTAHLVASFNNTIQQKKEWNEKNNSWMVSTCGKNVEESTCVRTHSIQNQTKTMSFLVLIEPLLNLTANNTIDIVCSIQKEVTYQVR